MYKNKYLKYKNKYVELNSNYLKLFSEASILNKNNIQMNGGGMSLIIINSDIKEMIQSKDDYNSIKDIIDGERIQLDDTIISRLYNFLGVSYRLDTLKTVPPIINIQSNNKILKEGGRFMINLNVGSEQYVVDKTRARDTQLTEFIKKEQMIIFIKSIPQENIVIFIDLQNNVYKYNFSSGNLLLTFNLNLPKGSTGINTVEIKDNMIVVGNMSGLVIGCDLTTGTEKYRADLYKKQREYGIVSSIIIESDKTFVFCSQPNNIPIFPPRRSQILRTFQEFITTINTISNDNIVTSLPPITDYYVTKCISLERINCYAYACSDAKIRFIKKEDMTIVDTVTFEVYEDINEQSSITNIIVSHDNTILCIYFINGNVYTLQYNSTNNKYDNLKKIFLPDVTIDKKYSTDIEKSKINYGVPPTTMTDIVLTKDEMIDLYKKTDSLGKTLIEGDNFKYYKDGQLLMVNTDTLARFTNINKSKDTNITTKLNLDQMNKIIRIKEGIKRNNIMFNSLLSCFSYDGKYIILVLKDSKTIVIVDTVSTIVLNEYKMDDDITSMTLLPDNRVILCSFRNRRKNIFEAIPTITPTEELNRREHIDKELKKLTDEEHRQFLENTKKLKEKTKELKEKNTRIVYLEQEAINTNASHQAIVDDFQSEINDLNMRVMQNIPLDSQQFEAARENQIRGLKDEKDAAKNLYTRLQDENAKLKKNMSENKCVALNDMLSSLAREFPPDFLQVYKAAITKVTNTPGSTFILSPAEIDKLTQASVDISPILPSIEQMRVTLLNKINQFDTSRISSRNTNFKGKKGDNNTEVEDENIFAIKQEFKNILDILVQSKVIQASDYNTSLVLIPGALVSSDIVQKILHFLQQIKPSLTDVIGELYDNTVVLASDGHNYNMEAFSQVERTGSPYTRAPFINKLIRIGPDETDKDFTNGKYIRNTRLFDFVTIYTDLIKELIRSGLLQLTDDNRDLYLRKYLKK